MAKLRGQSSEPDFTMMDTVAGLSERLAAVEESLESLMDERSARVAENFATLNANVLSLHERIELLEYDARSSKPKRPLPGA